MLSLQSIAVFLLLTPISQAIPHHNRTNTLGEVLRELSPKPDQLAINKRDTTDYRTMPPGTYTETISTSLVRIIIVNDPTPTLCPAECDCSGIKDKKSPEYFQCLTSSRCRPCREPAITASSTTAKPTATCPPYCDCTRVKDKQSEEYFQCLTNANCQKCRIGGPPSTI